MWNWQKADEQPQEDCFINTLVVGDHSKDYPPVITGPNHLVSALKAVGREVPQSPPMAGMAGGRLSPMKGSPAKGARVPTRMASTGKDKKPNLVMVHGYAAALGFYFRNYDSLAEHFNVYAIDQLG